MKKNTRMMINEIAATNLSLGLTRMNEGSIPDPDADEIDDFLSQFDDMEELKEYDKEAQGNIRDGRHALDVLKKIKFGGGPGIGADYVYGDAIEALKKEVKRIENYRAAYLKQAPFYFKKQEK